MTRDKINLKIGLLQFEPGWEIILTQIGIRWEIIHQFNTELDTNYSVIILNAPYSTIQQKALEQFLINGGTILTVYGYGDKLLSITAKKKYFRSIEPIKRDYCNTNDILDINAFGRILGTDDISLHHISNGIIINIPFDVGSLLINTNSQRKNFYSISKRFPNEVVSMVSKCQIRYAVSSSLEYLHHQRKLPFIHSWYFPNNSQTLFTFRIDSDKGNQQEIEDLFQLSEKYHIPTTWFLDVKSHEVWLSYFQKFQKQEIGIHCYEHKVFDNEIEMNADFQKAYQLLKNISLEVKGASAPYGKWKKSVSIAYENLGFLFSSEFSFDYDNFPSHPWLGNKFSSVLQLPIHPICPGTMRRSALSVDDQINYFVYVIHRKKYLREPICFYHHPKHPYNKVIEFIFKYINEQKIEKYSYRQYAEWWKKRINTDNEFCYDLRNRTITSKQSAKMKDVWYRISMQNHKEVIQPIESDIQIDTITFNESPPSYSIPPEIFRTRKFDWRHFVINAIESIQR